MTTKRSLVLVAALLIITVWAMPAFAQQVYEGQITSLSAPGMIAIKDMAGREWLFAIAPETIVRRNSMPVRLGDLRLNDNAVVMANDNRLAILIEVRSRL